jgi:hypothetical protein
MIKAAYITRLPGKPGSNLEVSLAYPETNLPREDILRIMLPTGAGIDEFFEEQIEEDDILVYTFHIPNEGFRADLASIGLVYDKPTNKYVLKDVIGELFKFLHKEELVTVEILTENLPLIVDALNKEVKLTIETENKKHVFDIPGYIKKRTNEIVAPLKNLWE